MILSCLNGEFFDSNVLECVVIPTTPTPCLVPDNICEGKQLELIANPCSCYRYVVCYLGENVLNAECPLDTIFDPSNKE